MDINPFESENLHFQQEKANWGLEHLSDTAYLMVKTQARDYLEHNKAETDDEKRAVYHKIAEQYREYLQGYKYRENKQQNGITHAADTYRKTEKDYPRLYIRYNDRIDMFIGTFSEVNILGEMEDLNVTGKTYVECAEKATKLLAAIKEETIGLGDRIKKRLNESL